LGELSVERHEASGVGREGEERGGVLTLIDKLALAKTRQKRRVFWPFLGCFFGYFCLICQCFSIKVAGKKFGIFLAK